MEVKDIAEYEENDSQLAKYTIETLQSKINRAMEYMEAIRNDNATSSYQIGNMNVIANVEKILKGEE